MLNIDVYSSALLFTQAVAKDNLLYTFKAEERVGGSTLGEGDRTLLSPSAY